MTPAEFLACHDLPGLRKACGIRQSTIARALGISQAHMSFLERGLARRHSDRTAAYARIVAGMARHLSIPEEGPATAASWRPRQSPRTEND